MKAVYISSLSPVVCIFSVLRQSVLKPKDDRTTFSQRMPVSWVCTLLTVQVNQV